MTLRRVLKRMLRRCGWDVVRFKAPMHPRARRQRILNWLGIDFVLDVGANKGQYALDLRELGYRGTIMSFEPIEDAFNELSALAATDPDWEARHVGLGAEEGRLRINVAQNSVSSSFLPMSPELMRTDPEFVVHRQEDVRVCRLDELVDSSRLLGRRTLLKIDTQGFERRVLEGASGCLQHMAAIELEVSLEPLYEGSPSMEEMLSYMRRCGFRLVDIEPEFGDRRTGRLLQFNGTFASEVAMTPNNDAI